MAQRADLILVHRGLFESRSKARAAIDAGLVLANGVLVTKPAEPIDDDALIEARPEHPWVSRAGMKLDAALDLFGIDPNGRTCLDVGASTGGFTQVLLARGATAVYAVDVGHDQLHVKLRDDPRVTAMEGVDARSLAPDMFAMPIGLVVCDASFISLRLILPTPLALAAPGAFLIALIKPQFEVGRARVGKNGIVRDSRAHEDACFDARALLGLLGWRVLGVEPSPIHGGDGNREFLIAARKPE